MVASLRPHRVVMAASAFAAMQVLAEADAVMPALAAAFATTRASAAAFATMRASLHRAATAVCAKPTRIARGSVVRPFTDAS